MESFVSKSITTSDEKNRWLKCLFLLALIVGVYSTATAQEEIWRSYSQAGFDALNRGDYAKSEMLFRSAITEAAKLKEDKRSSNMMIVSLNGLGEALRRQDKFADAEKANRYLVELLKMLRSEDDREYSIALNNLGLVLSEQGKYVEAEDIHRKALSLRERYQGPKHPDVAISLLNLGKLKFEQGDNAQAEALYSRAINILTNIPRTDRDDEQMEVLLMCANNLALIHVEEKKYSQAERLYKICIETISTRRGVMDPELPTYLLNYAHLLRLMKRPREAQQLEARANRIRNPQP